MIQYTGTSSQSNYNDERTATIGLATTRLPRRLGVGFDRSFAPVHLLFPSSATPSLSPQLLLLFFSFSLFPLASRFASRSSTAATSPSLPLYLVSFATAASPLFLLPSGGLSGVARTATRANIHHGVVTGPRSHGGWILAELFLDPPELSRGHRGGSIGRKCVISGIRAARH